MSLNKGYFNVDLLPFSGGHANSIPQHGRGQIDWEKHTFSLFEDLRKLFPIFLHVLFGFIHFLRQEFDLSLVFHATEKKRMCERMTIKGMRNVNKNNGIKRK